MEQGKADEIGRFIGDALKRRGKRDSQRAAAERAGISEGWWRQVVNGGYRKEGVWFPAKAAPETYISMAAAVGVEAEVREMLGDEAPPRVLVTVPELSVDDIDFEVIPSRVRLLRPDLRRHILNQLKALEDLTAARPVEDAPPGPGPRPAQHSVNDDGVPVDGEGRRTPGLGSVDGSEQKAARPGEPGEDDRRPGRD